MSEYKYLGNNKALVKLRQHDFIVDTSSDDLALPIIVGNEWESQLMDLALSKLEKGGTFVDIGANIGCYSILAAHKIGPTGKVISFEPNPRTIEVLKGNVVVAQLSGTAGVIEVKEFALGSRSGSFNLMYENNRSGGAYISNDPNARRTEKGWINTEVQVKKWSEIFPVEFKPDLIKIDVEGHEVDVLRGAEDFIKHANGFSILMEAIPDMWRGQGHDPIEFIKYLKGLGFSISLVEHSGEIKKIDDAANLVEQLDFSSKSGFGGHLLTEK